MKNLNHKAVATAVLFQQVFGFLWYSPFLFLKPWLEGQGKSLETLGPPEATTMLIGLLCSVVFTYGMAGIVNLKNANSFKAGWNVGGYIAVSFAITELLAHYKFLQLGWNTILVDCVSVLIIAHVTGGILAAWRK